MNSEKLLQGILEGQPDIIAFSTYIFNIECVLHLTKKIKKLRNDVIIVYGGIEAESRQQELIKYCNTILVGNGEFVFKNWLLNKMPKGVFSTNDCGLCDNTISPYSDEYFKSVQGKIAYFESTRGCPFKCTYCMSADMKLSYFDLDYVKRELAKFKGKNIKVLKFVDRTFNLKNNFSKQILKQVIENSSEYDFPTHFEVAPELFDDEYFDLIKQAIYGKLQFEVGMQSFNDATLVAINRKGDSEKIYDNIKKLVSIGNCVVHLDLIAGLPYEDISSLSNSFNRAYSLSPQEIQLGMLKILPNSHIEKDVIKYKYEFNSNAPYEITQSAWLTASEVNAIKDTEIAVNKLYNSGKFKRTLSMYMGDNPFKFFYDFAVTCGSLTGIKLYDVIEILLKYLVNKGYDQKEVIEVLRYDYFITNNSRIVPPCLYVPYTLDVKKYKKKYKGYITQSSFDFNNNCFVSPMLVLFDYLNYDIVKSEYKSEVLLLD